MIDESEVKNGSGTVSTPVIEPVEVTGDALEIRRSKKLRGSVSFPGDAHQAMLACGIAALCEESVRIGNLPDAPWFTAYRAALESIGVVFEPVPEPVEGPDQWLVRGGALNAPEAPLAVGHELAALILAGLCSGRKLGAVLVLDPVLVPADTGSLLRVLYPQPQEPSESGAGREGVTGIRIGEVNPKARGRCTPFERKWNEGAAKIALLFHHLAAGESLELHLRRQGSDLLENLLHHFEIGITVERDDDREADELTRRIARQMRAAGKEAPMTRIKLPAAAKPAPVFLSLAGDATEAAAVALAATLVRGSDVLLEHVLLNSGRGGFLAALRRMGADIEVVQRRDRFGESQGTLRARTGELMAKRFDGDSLSDLRDEIFLLLAAASYAEGETVFRDLNWLRLGAADLLRDFTAALKRAGVETGEIEDGLVIRGRGESDGGHHDSLGHPGLALACVVIALKSHGASSLTGEAALAFRHPGLLARIESLTSAAAAEKTP